ncbi:MAG: protein kinase [Myxococcota bacterium]
MRVCHQCGSAAREDDRFCATCGASLFQEGSSGNKDPLIGRTIGAYVVQEIVGVGGMGRVYRAEQTSLGRTVAIKVIHPHLLGDEQTVARFYTEARAASRLNHPNSVSIIDFGRTDDGILYLAMEFLKGKDLAMVMQDEGPLPFRRICDVLAGTLDALGEAHALDIVHRDLKPENIILRQMRTGDDLVKVVDFGLATIVGGGGTSITKPGLVCGTPDYMSPEQGRGEDVDGRGDLYACGVVLFELLTDQLPFDEETPTKVVLRHINDPVPDPRETAPHRSIPDVLAEVTMKALAKRREDRYQSAADMAAAVRRARDQLAVTAAKTITCPSCGAENPSSMRFCGACGSRLASEVAQAPTQAPPRKVPKASFYPAVVTQRPFVGRSAEMKLLDDLREKADGQLIRVVVEGEAGVGKTRLLREMAERYAEKGDVVAGASAHAFGVPVPYGPIRTIVAALLDVEESELGRLAHDADTFADALTRSGLDELSDPRGVVGLEQSRVGAVAEALAISARVAMGKSGGERAILVIDDFYRCDGLTHLVIDRARAILEEDSVMLVTTDLAQDDDTAEKIELQGLDQAAATLFLDASDGQTATKATLPAPNGRRLLPLYLEQIHALGSGGIDDTLPPRLADAVAQRIERLSVYARRVLQAIAAFGGSVDLKELREIVDREDLEGLDELQSEALINVQATRADITHPFVAELVEAFIPASARKELHARILQLKTEASAPLEIRAEHAYRGGEMLPTLMTLERMGDVAISRGDPRAAILAYRRALELARREMLETGETVLDTAIVTFSRKLGWALAVQGDLAGADGVVREVLDLTHRHDPARARMHLVLGRVSSLRDRRRDAMRHFGQALEIVAGVDATVESEVQVALGRMRRDAGDPNGAANAYRRALELYDEMQGRPLDRALTTLELAEVLFAAGERERCVERAEEAKTRANDAHAPALEARAAGLLAKVLELDGSLEKARSGYASAIELAAAAGDAVQSHRWAEAERLLAS